MKHFKPQKIRYCQCQEVLVKGTCYTDLFFKKTGNEM